MSRHAHASPAARCVALRLLPRLLGSAGALVMAAITFALTAAPAGAAPRSAQHVAHAGYGSSVPAANAVLTSAPSSVTITFVQQLDPKGLSITVYGNKGNVVSTGQAQISATDPKTASVTMKGDDSDIYRVDWTTVSAEDGDPTLGAFVFAVDPSGKSDKVAASTTTTTSSSTGLPAWSAILAGVLGLVVGGGAGYLVSRQRAA
jgi:copper resistance protein C